MDVAEASFHERARFAARLGEVLPRLEEDRLEVDRDQVRGIRAVRRELRVGHLEELAQGPALVHELDRVVEGGRRSGVDPEADDLLPAAELQVLGVQQAGRVDDDVEAEDVDRLRPRIDVGLAFDEEDQLEVGVRVRVEVPDPALLVEPLAELEGRVLDRDLLEESADSLSIHATDRPLADRVGGRAAIRRPESPVGSVERSAATSLTMRHASDAS